MGNTLTHLPNHQQQSFGEVNQITRMPNGDLHIDFRKAEVADTVGLSYYLVLYPGKCLKR